MNRALLRPPRLKLAMFPLLVLLALTAGCANLTAIREFASISAESAQYTKLVNDYVESPIRQKRYQPASKHQGLDRMAAQRLAERERLILRQALIVEYMDALGRLAADESVTYDLDRLGNAVKEAKFADAKETDAFAKIAKVLVDGATDRWRQKQLKKLITASNEPFQGIVEKLRFTVESGFGKEDLLNEKAALQEYCRDLVLESRDKAGIAALQEWCDLRQAEIDARARAIESYLQILKKIAQGHQQLYEGRDDLSKEQLLQKIRGYTKELRTTFAMVRD